MINKVILVGNLGAEPEVRVLDGGSKVAKIRVATTERRFDKGKNEYVTLTEWHSVTLWGSLADVADKYLIKGSQVYIEGKLRTREYTKDNVKCYTTEVLGEELKMLGKRENAPAATPAPAPAIELASRSIDEPPF